MLLDKSTDYQSIIDAIGSVDAAVLVVHDGNDWQEALATLGIDYENDEKIIDYAGDWWESWNHAYQEIAYK